MAACACATASTRRSTTCSRASTAAAGPAPSTGAKFLELGGFDALLAPFYLEDTDLGYMAWKRGWKVLYQPRSVVYHEHRGTIGKRFSEDADPGGAEEELPAVLLEEHPRMAAAGGAFLLRLGGRAAERGLRRRAAAAQPARRSGARSGSCRGAVRSRWRARGLAADERYGSLPAAAGRLFPRPFRARWSRAPERLRVLFVSPYPDLPAGARRRRVHVPDAARDGAAAPKCTWWSCWTGRGRRRTTANCASSAPRRNGWCAPAAEPEGFGSLLPHAVREFANDDLEWLIHRQLYRKRIDVLQLEYTPMAQYRGEYRRIARGAVRARYLLPIDRRAGWAT